MSVYTIRVGAGASNANELINLYTVPPGNVLVLRDILITAPALVPSDVQLGVIGFGYLFNANITNPNVSFIWQGRQVVEPGEEVFLYHSDSTLIYYWVTGYLLAN